MDSMDNTNQKQETINSEEELEICIKCGTLTNVKKTDNVIYRSGYIEGAGQLCFKCSQTRKMHKTGSYETTEWSRYGL